MLCCVVPQGTYVLQDNRFILLTQLSSGKQYMEEAPKVRKPITDKVAFLFSNVCFRAFMPLLSKMYLSQ